MGRISMDSLDNYGNSGNNGSFFKLSKDKETAHVRIMLNKPTDLDNHTFAVHEVKVGDKTRYVNCLRDYDEPVSKCPFCEAQYKVIPKMFIPLYNEDKEEVQVWDRGKKFANKISSFMARYSKPSIVAHLVEIERNGKPNDMSTTYELYEVDKDDTTLKDLPEVPDALGTIILDKSADDMNYYLDTKEFPPTDDEEEEAPVRRRSSRHEEVEEADEEEPPFEEDEEEEQPKRRSSSARRTPGKSRRSF